MFLDGLHGASRRAASRERLVQVEARHVQSDREQAREPAHRGRQVRAGDDVLFAAVALQLEQGRGLVHTPCAPPLGHRQGEGREEAVVDAAVERGRDLGQQGLGDVGGELDADVVQAAPRVDGGVERAGAEERVGAVEDPLPQTQLGRSLRRVRLLDQGVRPAAYGGAGGRQLRVAVDADLLPGGGEVRQQDAPGDTVDDQVVQGDDEAPGDLGVGRVEPHELRHDPGGRVQSPGRRVEFGGHPRVAGLVPLPVVPDPAHQRARVQRPRRTHREAVAVEP